MIDTDKYEGHTEGEWRVDDKVGLVIKHGERAHDYVDMENKANAQLMADAPLLLAEVKRLREELALYRQGVIDATLMYPDLYNYLPLYLRELIE